MEQGHPSKKDKYERIIDKHRDTMTDDEIGVFFVLHEEGNVESAARVLGMTTDEVSEVIERYIPKKKERVSKHGEPYKQRLLQEDFETILATYSDLDDEERKILSAMIGRRNKTMAAVALNMSLKDYEHRFKAIRRKYGF